MTTTVRTFVRWGATQALPAAYLGRSARRGDPLARLLRDPSVREDPHPLQEALRARGPLVPGGTGLVTTSHAVAAQVLRSEAFGVGVDRAVLPRPLRWALGATDELDTTGVVDAPSLLAVDPPDHTRLRRLVSRAFTPRAVAALEPAVRRTADELLDDLEQRAATTAGPVDLVAGYAGPLPVLVIADLLGVPRARREEFLTWGAAAAVALDPGLPLRRYAVAQRGLRGLHGFLREHFARRRRDPGDDLVSALLALPPQDALTEAELHATVLLLLGAGFETTVNLIGNAVVALDAHRDQWAALAADPAGWPGAVEEVLRWDSPVQLTGRTARTDAVVAGQPVAAGQRVTVLLGAANRDPAVFAGPARFDVTRPNARDHLSFSAGVHYCLGAGLARLEGAVALQALTERLPQLRVAGRPVRRDLRTLRGFSRLPVAVG